MQIWCSLSKPVTNAPVSFGNFFNSVMLSPSFSAQEKNFSENAVCYEWAISVCLGNNDKNSRESFAWGTRVKIRRFNLLTHNKCVCSNRSATNLKLFHNHGGIYRFRKKFKKDSGEVNPLGAHRNMRGCCLILIAKY